MSRRAISRASRSPQSSQRKPKFCAISFLYVWLVLVLAYLFLGSAESVYTRDTQDRTRQSVAIWQPNLTSADDGEVHVLPVQGNVYMLAGAGGNITVQAGDDGVLLVDTGLASMSEKVLAAIKTISPRGLRYIINTNEREDHTGGNEKIAATGTVIPFSTQSNPWRFLSTGRATIVSFLTVYNRMAAPTGAQARTPEGAWPDDTYSTPQKKLFFNHEPIVIVHQPADTDGNSMVFFRKSDVVSTGDLFDTTGYPFIDVKAGGSIQAIVEGLNRLIDITVPSAYAEGGTRVIPGHGRLCDQGDVVVYQQMVTVVRDRIQDMIKRGMTLAQVKAAGPTREYDGRYGKQTGAWTTDMFVEAAYQTLSRGRS